MGRTFKPKTNRVRVSSEVMENAVKRVLSGESTRKIAKEIKISRSSLQRQVNKAKKVGESSFTFNPNSGNRRIFTLEEEKKLCDYLITASKMCYGLSTTQTRELGYQYAMKLNKSIPATWEDNKCAGLDWLRGFMGRNPTLSLRTPEATSLSRATAFNKHNVETFFQNLENVLQRDNIAQQQIYNCDETGLMTVVKPPKVVAPCGTKQVGQVTSAERGSLVTMLNFICANGNTVPPVFIFPRANFKEYMLNNAPPGSLGLAHRTGWITEENFLRSLHHFVKFVKPTKENKVLLLLDNHESHVSINIINYARENGIILLTFPPHCSHKLQPLDVGVYGPFKTYFRSAQNNHITTNAGKPITIYDLPSLAAHAFNKAFTRDNILSAFKKTGISPFNNDIFEECDFLSSYATDRPDPTIPETVTPNTSNIEVNMKLNSPEISQASNSDLNEAMEHPSTSKTTFQIASTSKLLSPLSPEDIRPFPKAGPRKNEPIQRGRKKGQTRVLTDTPVKNTIELETQNRKLKKSGKAPVKRKFYKKIKQSKRSKFSSDEDEESEGIISNSETDEANSESEDFNFEEADLNANSWILVSYESQSKKHVKRFFIGQVQSKSSDGLRVKFARKIANDRYKWPTTDDIAEIDEDQVEKILPQPKMYFQNDRVTSFSFGISFKNLVE